jgi:hypothetical protein
MDSAREIQTKIISLINNITDVNQLSAIHVDIQQKAQEVQEGNPEILPWQDSIAKIRDGISFEDLIKEQGQKSISYEEISKLSEGIRWENSLEELLEMLD